VLFLVSDYKTHRFERKFTLQQNIFVSYLCESGNVYQNVVKVKVELSLWLTNHHAIKVYG
jgi:hypothetical protein